MKRKGKERKRERGGTSFCTPMMRACTVVLKPYPFLPSSSKKRENPPPEKKRRKQNIHL
jgi:hypothetical protein